MRAGGGFVTFQTVGRAAISVLIAPGLPVRFEVLDSPEEQVASWQENPPRIEVDGGDFDLATMWEWN